MRNLPVLAAFLAVVTSPIVATHAASQDSPRSETVRYGDLDPDSAQGAVALFRRLHNAAADVCSEPSEARAYDAVPRYVRCVDHAMSDAVSAVDRPAVTAYAQAHGVHGAVVSSGKDARPN
jgi:UrcA family protein